MSYSKSSPPQLDTGCRLSPVEIQSFFLAVLANPVRQIQMNGVNTGREAKAISLFADNRISNLENSEALTQRKSLWTNFFKKQLHKYVTM